MLTNQDVLNKIYEVFIRDDTPFNISGGNKKGLNTCQYYPVSQNTKGCALGIFMTPDQARVCDKLVSSGIAEIVRNGKVHVYFPKQGERKGSLTVLPPKYEKIVDEVTEMFKGCNSMFLSRCQEWHDSAAGHCARVSEDQLVGGTDQLSVVSELHSLAYAYNLKWPGDTNA